MPTIKHYIQTFQTAVHCLLSIQCRDTPQMGNHAPVHSPIQNVLDRKAVTIEAVPRFPTNVRGRGIVFRHYYQSIARCAVKVFRDGAAVPFE